MKKLRIRALKIEGFWRLKEKRKLTSMVKLLKGN